MATKEIPFRTAYSEPVRVNAPTGKPTIETWGYEMKKDGSKVLVVNGEENVYEKIQAELENTKIENILKRASIGDYSDFRPDGIYMDCSEIPDNMIEAQNAIIKMENTWAKLPQEIKEKYDNNIGKYIAAAGTEKWMKDMGLIKEEPGETKTEPVKEEKGEVKDE